MPPEPADVAHGRCRLGRCRAASRPRASGFDRDQPDRLPRQRSLRRSSTRCPPLRDARRRRPARRHSAAPVRQAAPRARRRSCPAPEPTRPRAYAGWLRRSAFRPRAWHAPPGCRARSASASRSSRHIGAFPPSDRRMWGRGRLPSSSCSAAMGAGGRAKRFIASGNRTTLSASRTGYCRVVTTRSNDLAGARGWPSRTMRVLPSLCSLIQRATGTERRPMPMTRSGQGGWSHRGSPRSDARSTAGKAASAAARSADS